MLWWTYSIHPFCSSLLYATMHFYITKNVVFILSIKAVDCIYFLCRHLYHAIRKISPHWTTGACIAPHWNKKSRYDCVLRQRASTDDKFVVTTSFNNCLTLYLHWKNNSWKSDTEIEPKMLYWYLGASWRAVLNTAVIYFLWIKQVSLDLKLYSCQKGISWWWF